MFCKFSKNRLDEVYFGKHLCWIPPHSNVKERKSLRKELRESSLTWWPPRLGNYTFIFTSQPDSTTGSLGIMGIAIWLNGEALYWRLLHKIIAQRLILKVKQGFCSENISCLNLLNFTSCTNGSWYLGTALALAAWEKVEVGSTKFGRSVPMGFSFTYSQDTCSLNFLGHTKSLRVTLVVYPQAISLFFFFLSFFEETHASVLSLARKNFHFKQIAKSSMAMTSYGYVWVSSVERSKSFLVFPERKCMCVHHPCICALGSYVCMLFV